MLSLLNVLSAFQVSALTLDDIGYDGGEMFLRVLNRSNHEQEHKFIRLSGEVQDRVERYLGEGRRGSKTNALFLNRFGGRLSLRSIWELRPREAAEQTVYFIADEHNRIKIGKAKRPVYRLGGMQVDNADKLRLVAVEPNGENRERELHKKFHHLHIRGEWYRGERELLDYMARLPQEM